jgi:hypothetical protein
MHTLNYMKLLAKSSYYLLTSLGVVSFLFLNFNMALLHAQTQETEQNRMYNSTNSKEIYFVEPNAQLTYSLAGYTYLFGDDSPDFNTINNNNLSDTLDTKIKPDTMVIDDHPLKTFRTDKGAIVLSAVSLALWLGFAFWAANTR